MLFLDAISKKKTNEVKPIQIEEYTKFDESGILTHDDVRLARQGMGPQRYHAYLLFDFSDINFATQIIGKLEDMGLKVIETLCVSMVVFVA